MQLSPLDIQNSIPTFGGTPTLEGFDTTNIQDGQRIGGPRGRQHVVFYEKKVPVFKATGEKDRNGVPKRKVEEETKLFVRVITPGDKNIHDDVATDWHMREFWPQYKAFKDGRTAPLGKDLDECADYISPGVATELKYLGCHTEEQLAEASDILCNQIPDGWQLREMARAMCQMNQSGGGQVRVLKAELEKSQDIIRHMQEEMQQMKGMILSASGKVIEPEVIEQSRKSRKKEKDAQSEA